MSYDKRVRVIVCFGDIRGFSSWEQGLTDPEGEFLPIMNKFDDMIIRFGASHPYFTKQIGDGFMVLVELEPGHNCGKAALFLNDTFQFGSKISRMISESSWPRPDGFRLRVACGHVWKKSTPRGVDYLGRHINMAHKLLRVSPTVLYVCHQGVKELCNSKQCKNRGLRFSKLLPDRRIPDGLSRHDMDCLYKFEKAKAR